MHITDVRTTQPVDKNACLSASVDEAVQMTVLLPMTPVKAAKPTSLGTVAKVGLALDGVPIFADAPSVLQTGHMPALDTCGGHVDPGGWYHWHAASTDINTVFKHEHVDASCALKQKADALFAYAFDGSVDSDGKVPTPIDAPRRARRSAGSRPVSPGFDAAAKDLKVTEAALKAALPRPPPGQ